MPEDYLITALNRLFWKLPAVDSAIDADGNGEWWAAELQDGNIPVIWDKENHEFKYKTTEADKQHWYQKLTWLHFNFAN